MFKTYGAAFRLPGTRDFSVAGFLARFSMAVYPIGFLLLISSKTGHYSFAGVLSGIYVISNGVGNPVLGRLVDRYGQSRLLLPTTAVHVAGLITIVALVQAKAPNSALVAPTIVVGFFFLPIGSLVRARWSYVLAGKPELTTAYSLESAFDEVIFTFGPFAATIVATQIEPVWVFVVAGILVSAGVVWLQRQRRTEPPAHDVDAPRHKSALRYRGLILLMFVAASMGALFASAEVTMVAFCGQHHEKAFSGVALGCFAGGSAVSGFIYGARVRTTPVLDRFRRQALILGAVPALFLASVNVPMLAVIAFVVGLGIAPTLITAFGLVENVIPNAALTEGMSWLITGLSLGYGIASSLVGRIADAHHGRTPFTVAIGAGVLVCVLAFALHVRLRAASEPVAVA
jgi:MFS family permease